MAQTISNDAELDRLIKNYCISIIRPGYADVKGARMVNLYTKYAEEIENFEVRDDDIWICTFPKAGTTWTQEMIWCICNDLDFETAKKVSLGKRFPFLELSTLFDYSRIAEERKELTVPKPLYNSVETAKNLPVPRFIKTHLPFQLLPKQIRTGEKKPRIVYVARNPKDNCISYYHHCQLLESYSGNFDDFCKLFLANKLTYCPIWEHVLDFWKMRDRSDILFLKFEEMKADLPSVIRKTAAFLDRTLTDDQVKQLAEHLSFANMKNNRAVNYEEHVEFNRKMNLSAAKTGSFIRSGQVEQWKGRMSQEQIDQFDKLIKEKYEPVGLTF